MSSKLLEAVSMSELYHADCPNGLLVPHNGCTDMSPLAGDEFSINKHRYRIDDGFFNLENDTDLKSQFGSIEKYQMLPVFGKYLRILRPPSGYPSPILSKHWADVLNDGVEMEFKWGEFGENCKHIVRYPLENLAGHLHMVDPDVLYEVTAKSFIATIPCGQAKLLKELHIPSVLKLDRCNGGHGVFVIRNKQQYDSISRRIQVEMPLSTTILTEYIEQQTHNYDAVLYIHKNGGFRWLGTVEQNIDDSCHYVGCTCDLDPQADLENLLRPTVQPVAKRLQEKGYFGMVTIDILLDALGKQYVIDINPRWGGCTASLLGLLRLQASGQRACISSNRRRFQGPLAAVLDTLGQIQGDGRILLSAAVDQQVVMCNLIVFAPSMKKCKELYSKVLQLCI